ncbi:hypothetical protein CAEBREN_06452 [Caenorhabditis brenneri]|uniref:Uncharacterized protein n=1 Tax=Caenorhabditis brenneri TaxID=135651 RepID=G0NL91_CAEBE|nr:hypothetical protein CAEBREN_06452 [Caenorhabditis brenneri]
MNEPQVPQCTDTQCPFYTYRAQLYTMVLNQFNANKYRGMRLYRHQGWSFPTPDWTSDNYEERLMQCSILKLEELMKVYLEGACELNRLEKQYGIPKGSSGTTKKADNTSRKFWKIIKEKCLTVKKKVFEGS